MTAVPVVHDQLKANQYLECPRCTAPVDSSAQFCPHCGHESPAPAARDDSFVGRMVSRRYRIVSSIASGGMGEVYRADHIDLQQTVAVKFLHRRFANDEELAARFLNEAKSASRLHHPHAVTVFDYGRLHDGTLYIVMEYVEGVTLTEFVGQRIRLDPAAAVRIARQLAEVMEAAHREHVVHRDIKPDNVMVVEGPGGRPTIKVLDFGIAKLLDDEVGLTQAGAAFGTPEYMSPEQAHGEPVDRRTDIYSFGLVVYFMLIGAPPFQGPNSLALLRRQVREIPPSLDEVSPVSLDPGLIDLVDRCLAKRADQRPASFEVVLDELDHIAGVAPATGNTPTEPAGESTLGRIDDASKPSATAGSAAPSSRPAVAAGRRPGTPIQALDAVPDPALKPDKGSILSHKSGWSDAVSDEPKTPNTRESLGLQFSETLVSKGDDYSLGMASNDEWDDDQFALAGPAESSMEFSDELGIDPLGIGADISAEDFAFGDGRVKPRERRGASSRSMFGAIAGVFLLLVGIGAVATVIQKRGGSSEETGADVESPATADGVIDAENAVAPGSADPVGSGSNATGAGAALGTGSSPEARDNAVAVPGTGATPPTQRGTDVSASVQRAQGLLDRGDASGARDLIAGLPSDARQSGALDELNADLAWLQTTTVDVRSHLDAGNCRGADEGVVEIRERVGRPNATPFYGALTACRDAQRAPEPAVVEPAAIDGPAAPSATTPPAEDTPSEPSDGGNPAAADPGSGTTETAGSGATAPPAEPRRPREDRSDERAPADAGPSLPNIVLPTEL